MALRGGYRIGDGQPLHIVLVGNPGSRRVILFQEALARLGLPPADVVAYADLLAGRASLEQAVRPATIVRIESPGKDFEVERALLALGADLSDGEQYERLSRKASEALEFDKGRLLPLRQWYLGFRAALQMIEEQLARCPPHRVMNQPADIALMFDKRQCHDYLSANGIRVPRALGPVSCFAELHERMREARCWRVFIKPAHGSSASGVVAYQSSRERHQAVTTVEVVRRNGDLLLYNSRRIQLYRDRHQIAGLIDALCRHCVHVEQWLPKAGFADQLFDLRVVVIGGEVMHTVARLSRSPLTNLHLLNSRGDPSIVLAPMRVEDRQALRNACERVMGGFDASLYAGIDVLISPDYRRHAVLEVNAFGDLLPGVLHQGLDTYAAEIMALGSGSQAHGAC